MNVAARWLRVGLARQAIVLVSLALLPLGGIALWQTSTILHGEQAAAARALMAMTERAATRERQIIERAIGAAAAMGNTAQTLLGEPAECRRALRQFEEASYLYTAADFFPARGGSPCLSGGDDPVTAPDPNLEQLIEQRRTGIYTVESPERGDDSETVLVVATAAFDEDRYVGHLRLQIPWANFAPAADGLGDERPMGLVTFNANGEILTSERSKGTTRSLLPERRSLTDLRSESADSFRDGDRVYSVIPLIPGTVYALGTWDEDVRVLDTGQSYWFTILLAVLMWLASVLVIFLIMQLLVIRDVQRLDRQLTRFRANRTLPGGAIRGRGELYDLEASFHHLAETILHDEAELEDAVHEKNVLLKEVHHRVKNNLQLINSIINMILRGARSAETQVVVRRLQDRVMALASVHRSIYQAQTMDRVDASGIVREIVNQSVAAGLPRGSAVDVEMELAQVTLYPDQAMPLSMLVSEGITNALKYVGGPAPFIRVRLAEKAGGEQERREVRLEIANSLPDTPRAEEGTGLGSQLVRAFAHQLEGQAEATERDGVHVLEVIFAVAGFSPETEDAATKHKDVPEAAE